MTSALPRGKAVATGQRLRWDHGGLLLVKRSPRLLWGALRRADLRRLGIAIDLTVPPVAGLCIAGLVVLGLTAAAAWAGAHPAALWLTAGAMGAIALGAGLSWAKFGRRIVPATALLGAPAYMLWKLPIYLRFFVRPHRDWNPTQREPL